MAALPRITGKIRPPRQPVSWHRPASSSVATPERIISAGLRGRLPRSRGPSCRSPEKAARGRAHRARPSSRPVTSGIQRTSRRSIRGRSPWRQPIRARPPPPPTIPPIRAVNRAASLTRWFWLRQIRRLTVTTRSVTRASGPRLAPPSRARTPASIGRSFKPGREGRGPRRDARVSTSSGSRAGGRWERIRPRSTPITLGMAPHQSRDRSLARPPFTAAPQIPSSNPSMACSSRAASTPPRAPASAASRLAPSRVASGWLGLRSPLPGFMLPGLPRCDSPDAGWPDVVLLRPGWPVAEGLTGAGCRSLTGGEEPGSGWSGDTVWAGWGGQPASAPPLIGPSSPGQPLEAVMAPCVPSLWGDAAPRPASPGLQLTLPGAPSRADGSRWRSRSRCPGPSSGSSWFRAAADGATPADRARCW